MTSYKYLRSCNDSDNINDLPWNKSFHQKFEMIQCNTASAITKAIKRSSNEKQLP